jgi:hypothetical protein
VFQGCRCLRWNRSILPDKRIGSKVRRSSSLGSITPDDYTENKTRYDQEISRLKQQIERYEEVDKSFYVTVTYLLQLFIHGEKVFEAATDEEKRELLKLLLSNLELKGKTVRFTPNEPFATVLILSEDSTWQPLMDELRNFHSKADY